MADQKSEISKFFLNLIGRFQGWGEKKMPTQEEINFKAEWYESYIMLLEKNIRAIDEVVNVHKMVIGTHGKDDEIRTNAQLQIAELELKKIDLEKELIAKKYYKDNYKFRIAQQIEINNELSKEADENFNKLTISAYQLLQHRGDRLDAKEKIRLTGMLYQKEQGFKDNETRIKLYGELLDFLKTIIARMESEEITSGKKQPPMRVVDKIDLSK